MSKIQAEFYMQDCPLARDLKRHVESYGGLFTFEYTKDCIALSSYKPDERCKPDEFIHGRLYSYLYVVDSFRFKKLKMLSNYLVKPEETEVKRIERKYRFSAEDDRKLTEYVCENAGFPKGKVYWETALAKGFFPGRTANSLKLHWVFLNKPHKRKLCERFDEKPKIPKAPDGEDQQFGQLTRRNTNDLIGSEQQPSIMPEVKPEATHALQICKKETPSTIQPCAPYDFVREELKPHLNPSVGFVGVKAEKVEADAPKANFTETTFTEPEFTASPTELPVCKEEVPPEESAYLESIGASDRVDRCRQSAIATACQGTIDTSNELARSATHTRDETSSLPQIRPSKNSVVQRFELLVRECRGLSDNLQVSSQEVLLKLIDAKGRSLQVKAWYDNSNAKSLPSVAAK